MEPDYSQALPILPPAAEDQQGMSPSTAGVAAADDASGDGCDDGFITYGRDATAVAITGDSDGYSGCMDNDVNEKIGAHVGAETRCFLSGDEGSAARTVYVDSVAYGIAPASGHKEGDRLVQIVDKRAQVVPHMKRSKMKFASNYVAWWSSWRPADKRPMNCVKRW
eukprot:s2669_g3.t2